MTDPKDSAIVPTGCRSANDLAPYRLEQLDGPEGLCLHDMPIDAVPELMRRNNYVEVLSGTDLPEDRCPDNQALALRVARLLTQYASNRGPEEIDALTVLRDFLNDARHLADLLGIPWSEADRDYHYIDQISTYYHD